MIRYNTDLYQYSYTQQLEGLANMPELPLALSHIHLRMISFSKIELC